MSLPEPDRVEQMEYRVNELEYQVGTYHTVCTGLAILVVIQTGMLLWALWGLYANG